LNYSHLVGWWPLNGNANDYSQYHDNGATAGGATFNRLSGYWGDSLDGGSFYRPSVSQVEGISQCYSMNSCSVNAPGRLYVPVQQSYSSNALQPAASSLGFVNDTMPSSGYFNGASSYILASNPFGTDPWYFYTDIVGNNNFGAYFNGWTLSSSPLTVNTWSYVCFTYGSGTVILYLDGVPDGSGSGSGSTAMSVCAWINPTGGVYKDIASDLDSTSSIIIGARNSGTDFFHGSIADVQIYSTGLSAAQIDDLYLNNTVPGVSPVGYWPLNGNPNDYSGNGHNGAATGVMYTPSG
jgi:hypothetical protein